jgi:hypothetical protein
VVAKNVILPIEQQRQNKDENTTGRSIDNKDTDKGKNKGKNKDKDKDNGVDETRFYPQKSFLVRAKNPPRKTKTRQDKDEDKGKDKGKEKTQKTQSQGKDSGKTRQMRA